MFPALRETLNTLLITQHPASNARRGLSVFVRQPDTFIAMTPISVSPRAKACASSRRPRRTGAPDALQTAERLATGFARTAAERDLQGGTPKAERDQLRDSGLLALSIPSAYGGLGASWRTTLDVVRVLAAADSSLAHVFGFHHLMLATVRLFGAPAQWESWFERTARQQWFWGNALNPLDARTVSRSRGAWHEFSGQKSFCSGRSILMLIASAHDAQTRAFLIAAVPTQRSGISIADDWNNIGQRQTDSGTVTFEKVRVEDHELLTDPGPLSTPFACLRRSSRSWC